jgi:DNA adenine methylase
VKIGRPLNYYGSKETMARHILALVPAGPSTWVELFCGSAVVTLNKPRHPKEVINDLNGEVINLFEVLRSPRAGELYAAIELTPFAEAEFRACQAVEMPKDPVERARVFLVASWMGRGGHGDAHRSGFRWSKMPAIAPEITWTRLPARLAAVAERLRGVSIRSTDAITLLGNYDSPDCLMFVDPPYPGPVGRRYAVKMDAAAHDRLAAALAATKARVILTMSEGTVYDSALAGWYRFPSKVVTDGGTVKPEVIMTNFERPGDLFSTGAA